MDAITKLGLKSKCSVIYDFFMLQEGHHPTEILLKPKEDSTNKLSYRKKQTD
jgi:hypothetical protein